MTNIAFIKQRVAYHLSLGSSGMGSTLVVKWREYSGGTLDEVTGAMVGAVEMPQSGVLRCFGIEEPPRTVLRQFAEIQAGDLIVDLAPEGLVTLADGSQVALEDCPNPRFEWGGRLYVQASVGEELAQAWSVIVADQKLGRTILLRKAT